MPEAASATPTPRRRPIVPYLQLGASDADPACLVGTRCKKCGAAYFSQRVACGKCGAAGQFEDARFSRTGKLYVFSVVHQSVPGVPTPFISAIVDLDDGPAVRCTLVDCEPDPARIPFDLPVEMITRPVRTDAEGVEVVAFFFRPRPA